MTSLNIEVYSDLICPWCYIGRRRLEAGIKLLDASEPPNILWRPFELNPKMPKAGLDRKAYRSAKFGSWEQSQSMDRDVAATGKTLGLEFNYDRVLVTPNTFAGHRRFGGQGIRVRRTSLQTLFSGPISQKVSTSEKMRY
jgi:predicted DsbA family dithiol-disulfide isomerase